MSVYINDLGEYPRYMGDVQLVLPEWQPGDALPAGWSEVVEVLGPSVDETQTYYEVAPIQVDGVWTQQWEVRPLTEEEIATRQAPITAREKLKTIVGLTDAEIGALIRGLR